MSLGGVLDLNQTIMSVSENAEAITSEITSGDVIFIILVLAVAYVLGLVVAHFMKLRLSHKLKKDQLVLLTNIVRTLILFIALCVSLPGVFHMSLAIVVLVVIGFILVVAMSSSAVVGNAAAGVGLLYERTFSPGDFVRVSDTSGTVVAVHLLSILIRTPDGVLVWIPNNLLYTTTLSNFHAHVARRYDFDIGIRYEDDVQAALHIIREIIESHTFVLKNPQPDVFVCAIDPDSVRIRFQFWVPSVWANTREELLLKTGFLPVIKDAFEAAGIEIPYSQQVIRFAEDLPAECIPGRK
jgi:small-conductance mechanosensitive channel